MFSSLLHRANDTQQSPPDAYLLYDLKKGIFWIPVKDFPRFVLEWIGLPHPPALTLDLTSAGSHALIFDLDYESSNPPDNRLIFKVIESILKQTFLPSLPHFTFFLAFRPQHGGIHIHLPEISLGHEDYILLCQLLQKKFTLALQADAPLYTLDILMNAMLPGAAKPGKQPYAPHLLVYMDERLTCSINVYHFHDEVKRARKVFPKRKSNEKSLFRALLNITNLSMFLGELKHLMFPIICGRNDVPVHTLHFATTIGKKPNNASNYEDIATFVYKKSQEPGYISKCHSFVLDQPYLLNVYHHLKLNACMMEGLESNNEALTRWYKRFGHLSEVTYAHIPPLFHDIHEMLLFEHMTLADNPDPVKTIMQFQKGYYFLPVFYALCQHYQMNSVNMAKELLALLDVEFHPLLETLRTLHPKNIQYAITGISINTLHFCANNLTEQHPKTHRDKLKSIVENNRRAILSVTNHDQLVELVRSMQERHLPIRVLKLKNALKKPSRFIWNALTESWQELTNSSEISDHILNLWSYVKQFLNEYRLTGGLGGPEEDLIHKFNVQTVVAAIMSDTAMERKDIQMDTHKWFLRLEEGVLDLLTGHIGGVVPEFFLSDRKIDLAIPRDELMRLCRPDPELVALYETLIQKTFFLQYLQRLFRDETDHLVTTLAALVPDATHELAKSMLHFYVNLCKCTSFEYDLLMYMLDILASVLVGTNYERKFFVWKGLTRNGKSKLFELMGRVLGGYYHSIQSENLTPGHSANNATPELASTLFSCRMVTTEELDKRLDENRVKQITGNSFVAFRNMYEQNSGGIPTAKLFATTNNYPECKASEAFKDRVVAIPFDAEFVDAAPETTSVQVEKNLYKKEVYVVEQSFKGCFFMLYYHLKKHLTPEDGLLHYREEPECVVEFTNDYLIHADIYMQFKLHMDVQLKAGCQTTMNEVKSAVRQFLKTTKNTAFHETDLFICFEKEFGDLRQTDLNLATFAFSYTSSEPPKKAKLDNESSLVFYDGVVIKNLRKQNFEDY